MDRSPDSQTPKTVYLRDYRPPAYRVDTVDLRFELDPEATLVEADLHVLRQSGVADAVPLQLDGEDLELLRLELDGRVLGDDEYRLEETGLSLPRVPADFRLRVVTRLRPAANTELSGLYTSSGNFCTQCEAEGFRRITFYPDRPDVMARFTSTVIADRAACPVLLSNGNPVASGELEDGRHYVTWEDPYPKPSYLFALVAGDLGRLEDRFTTCSGREITLHIYVEKHNLDRCDHAMASLKKAMRWDEEVYGREYDLDRYMIVAVDDFNMGAMENKGLNVFNSKFVLARPDTATDGDYQNIEAVIGHEYFHNWSGNRVTCRDWFQLSLKEGFTVFREQMFAADMTSAGVQRISDVNLLRSHQFREDAGPMAHPVRPDHYVAIDNFYTSTVYNKGAEVVRMLHTLLGPEAFRRGTDLYFSRHDGQAVTTDDFLAALEDANDIDLARFRRWYDQAGTPVLRIERHHDPAARTCALTLSQSTPPTPGQPDKAPVPVPVRLALLDAAGEPLPLRLYGETEARGNERVLELCGEAETFVFQDIPADPVPSLLRGFSAPVRLEIDYRDEELALLLARDTDPFGRWEAGQILGRRLLLQDYPVSQDIEPPGAFIEAFRNTLHDTGLDAGLRAQALSLPTETYLAEFVEEVDPVVLEARRLALKARLGRVLRADWEEAYQGLRDDGEYRIDAAAVGRRSLRNLCLSYLLACEDRAAHDLAVAQYQAATNMTDSLAALEGLVNSRAPERESLLQAFYDRWQDDNLVVDKWLAIQARSRQPDTLARVEALLGHPAFSLAQPNKVYALLRTFAQANPARFHAADGAGYRLIGEQARQLDAMNPQVAARLAGAFTQWRRYDASRRRAMRAELEAMRARPGVSRDLYEIADRSLEDDADRQDTD